jgi:hypothetical protein
LKKTIQRPGYETNSEAYIFFPLDLEVLHGGTEGKNGKGDPQENLKNLRKCRKIVMTDICEKKKG